MALSERLREGRILHAHGRLLSLIEQVPERVWHYSASTNHYRFYSLLGIGNEKDGISADAVWKCFVWWTDDLVPCGEFRQFIIAPDSWVFGRFFVPRELADSLEKKIECLYEIWYSLEDIVPPVKDSGTPWLTLLYSLSEDSGVCDREADLDSLKELRDQYQLPEQYRTHDWERVTIHSLRGNPFVQSLRALEYLAETAIGESLGSTLLPDPFVPTELQKKILSALKGRALTALALAHEVCNGDTGRLSKKGALKELKELGRVKNKRGLGYYRPDAPPPFED